MSHRKHMGYLLSIYAEMEKYEQRVRDWLNQHN